VLSKLSLSLSVYRLYTRLFLTLSLTLRVAQGRARSCVMWGVRGLTNALESPVFGALLGALELERVVVRSSCSQLGVAVGLITIGKSDCTLRSAKLA